MSNDLIPLTTVDKPVEAIGEDGPRADAVDEVFDDGLANNDESTEGRLDTFDESPNESLSIEPSAVDDLPEIVSTPMKAEHPLVNAPIATEPPAVISREILESLATLRSRIDRGFGDLQGAFEREGRAEASREKVIDRLHAELQEYKQDLLLNTLRPIFIDLIQLHDDIGKVAILPDEPSADNSRFVDLMIGFQEGLEDILYRQGVEPYRTEGDHFDPKRQRAVSTVPTDDPALVKTIASRHRKGFQSGDRVIRPEIVSVYAIKKT